MTLSTLEPLPTTTHTTHGDALARHLAAVHAHQAHRSWLIARGAADASLLDQFVRLAAYAGHLVRQQQGRA